jgi:hypothetical protein
MLGTWGGRASTGLVLGTWGGGTRLILGVEECFDWMAADRVLSPHEPFGSPVSQYARYNDCYYFLVADL